MKKIILLIPIFSIVVIFYFVLKKISLTSFPEKISSTTSAPQPIKSYEEKLLWVTHNYAYDQLQYSFELPFPGPFCECDDSEFGLLGIELSGSQGGFFKNIPIHDKPKWLAINAIFSPTYYLKTPVQGVPAGNFYQFLSRKKIGEKFLLKDENGKHNLTVRLPNKTIEGIPFLIFQSDLNASDIGSHSRMFAIFRKNNDVGYISFESDFQAVIYKNVFDHILETFTFRKRTDQLWEEVQKRFVEAK